MKKTLAKIFGITISVALVFQTISVDATTQKQLEKEKSQINTQIEDAKERQKEIEAQKSEAMKSVESLMSKIDTAEDEVDNLQSKIDELKTQIAQKEKDITSKEDEYNKQMELLDERMLKMYKSPKTGYLETFLTASNMTEFLAKYYAASELVSYDKKLMQETKAQKEQIESEKSALEENKKDLDNSLAEKESKSNELKTLKKDKETQVAKLTEEEKQTQKEIEELQAHEKTVSKKIEQMQREYDEQQRKNNNTNNSSGTNSSTGFGWPVKNNTIGTKYGASGKYWSSGHHTGVDFPVSTGTQVYSVGNGQVFDTGYSSAYGNFVEIYHGNNIYSFYAHGSKVQVSVGQKVSKGDPIMLSGRTGNVTGPHLHFEIRTPGYRYSNCVNPMKYLP